MTVTPSAATVERDRSSGPTDPDLVAAVRAGDDRAFEQLYGRYQRRIAAYIYGMVNDYARAEDITQDVFISALRRMRETERPIAFKPWIYEIAKNACIDQFRRSRRAEEVSYDAEEGLGAADYGRLVTTGPSLDAAVDTKQQLDHLCGAFGGLSETHHQILVLRELEGLSYREIGERMGLSRPSVESTLFRARRRLTEEYDELVSGQRCVRIQGIIESATEGMLGARDTRRLARHVAHCQPCRRQAIGVGIDTGTIVRRPVGGKVAARAAALFPFPLFLRGKRGNDVSHVTGGSGQGVMAQVPAFGAVAEPLVAGWGKAAVAAVTLGIASLGAGGVATVTSPSPLNVPAPSNVERGPAPAAPADSQTQGRYDAARRAGDAVRAGGLGKPAGLRGNRPSQAGGNGPSSPLRRLGAPPSGGGGMPNELENGYSPPCEIHCGGESTPGVRDITDRVTSPNGDDTPPVIGPAAQEAEDQARALNPQAGDVVSDTRDAVGI